MAKMLSARILGIGLLAISLFPLLHWLLVASKMSLFAACMLAMFGCSACIRIRANPETLKGRRILVTGCDTGIGLELARKLADLGAVVFAGCLSVKSKGPVELAEQHPDSVILLQLDVTNDQQVAESVRQVDAHLEAHREFLWAVVNNAGIQYSGDAELTTMGQARATMEVNFFGLLRVTKAFIPLLREKPGRLVNVSSIRGRCVWPFTGVYTASKFAVEALSDSLRLELGRFGIPVVMMEPSHYGGATGMLNDAARIRREFDEQWDAAEDEVKDVYGRDYVDALRDGVLNSAATSHPSIDPVVRDCLEALASDAPKDRYLTAGTNHAWYDEYKAMAVLRDFLPTSMHDLIVHWRIISGMPLPSAAADWLKRQRRPWFQ